MTTDDCLAARVWVTAMTPRHIAIGDITIGNDLPLVFIVGPEHARIRAPMRWK